MGSMPPPFPVHLRRGTRGEARLVRRESLNSDCVGIGARGSFRSRGERRRRGKKRVRGSRKTHGCAVGDSLRIGSFSVFRTRPSVSVIDLRRGCCRS
ncbi:hypothetical protein OH77DRAFT_1288627 [Trametes cingulata]|nr:hypothetical protein OH77DRAFT_1288627 [Trametes cingulata]